ncbi:hypothetical protein [Muribaculum intestinale]|uniref:hypothetical protein n=1 Tax=Muribaculum intestinale TaxID=1796646 RepID=UPI0025A9E3B8|nr:hypothetical protein [Muribaculum intestinale]
MANLPSPLEACKVDLFADESELREKYPVAIAARVMRLREMYNYWLANPSMKDRQLRDTIMSRFGVSQSTAYSDINIIHQLVPMLSQKSREYHRALANEMYLETYAMAKARKDTKAMAQIVASYAKSNRVDLDDEKAMPYDEIVVQPFCATLDVRVLGIEPIPDVYNYIDRLSKELLREHRDIIDIEFEEADLEEKHLFAPLTDDTDKSPC